MSLRCVLIGEDRAHHEVADCLTRRVVLEHPFTDWTVDHEWSHVFSWVAPESGHFVKHTHIKQATRRASWPAARLRLGKDASLEAPLFHRALVWAELDVDDRLGNIDVVFLARDTDGHDARREGFKHARESREWSFRVVGLIAKPEIEAWYIAGYEVRDDNERARLDAWKQKLVFDPTQSAHCISPRGPKQGKRDAKAILADLVDDDSSRQTECLSTRLDRLESRGRETGIADFLADVRSAVVLLLSRRR